MSLLLLLISFSQLTRPFVQPGAKRLEEFRPPSGLPLAPYLVVSVDVRPYGALILMLFDSMRQRQVIMLGLKAQYQIGQIRLEIESRRQSFEESLRRR